MIKRRTPKQEPPAGGLTFQFSLGSVDPEGLTPIIGAIFVTQRKFRNEFMKKLGNIFALELARRFEDPPARPSGLVTLDFSRFETEELVTGAFQLAAGRSKATDPGVISLMEGFVGAIAEEISRRAKSLTKS